MLIFDQLKKDDPQLRFLAFVTLGGLMILLAGLWWVQVVSTRFYRDKLEGQSIRTIRIPAVRGKILDREGRALAENEPRYNIAVYLEELSTNFQAGYTRATNVARQALRQQAAAKERELGRKLTPAERKQFAWTVALRDQVSRQSRYQVTSNLLADLAARLHEPLELSESNFDKHYDKALAIPLTVLSNLAPAQIAMFEEQSPLHTPGMDLNVQSVRHYPNTNLAAHVIGYLKRNNFEDDPSEYNYRLDDYTGVSGIEKLYDAELRGTPGEKAVLVNNYGYRQGETVVSPAEAGNNVVLTLDLDIQRAADATLATLREDERAAVVVMDVRNGDVLAMSSSPVFNPNYFAQRPPSSVWAAQWSRWTNEELEVELNHAMQGTYAPGSIFKIVVGMAALEKGLDPDRILTSPGPFRVAGRKDLMNDTAPAGDYNFERALALSCNYYFVTIVTNNPGAEVLPKIVELGQHLHFGERTGLIPRQEDLGYFPKPGDISARDWHIGNTANICIGQDKVGVTPLQIAVMISAVANGGEVFHPRLVSRLEPHDPDQPPQVFPASQLRDNLGVSARTLRIIHEAMRADVASPEGTGHEAAVDGLDIAGKTGTAEVEKNGHKEKDAKITWFASFAPIQAPRYAVVVMVVSGASGGKTCAPLAHDIYSAILKKERKGAAYTGPVAEIPK